jgi:hypothetical protein
MRKLVVATVVALAVSGCASSKPSLSIGMRQTALDLEFKVAKLARPVPRQVVIQYLPAPPTPAPRFPQVIVLPPLPGPPPLPPDPCPVAPYDAVPDANVALRPDRAPTPGTYVQRLQGTAKVTVGATSLTAVLPQSATVTVGRSTIVTPPPTDTLNQVAANPQNQTGPSAPGPQYDVVTHVTDRYVVTETFLITDTQVELVRRKVVDGAHTSVFAPTPAITFYKYGAQGTTWNSVGVDLGTGTAMLVQGAIGARQRIDVCGKLVDTYSVTLKTSMVNVQTGEQVMTSESDPSTFNIATQYGGVIVKRHVHETFTGKDPGTGESLTEEISYTTLANEVDPSTPTRG